MYDSGNIDNRILEFFNGSNSDFIDVVMLTLTSGVLWIPLYVVLLYVVIKNSDTMSQIMLVVGCALLCVAVTAGVGELVVKPLVARPRPCNEPLLGFEIDLVNGMRPKSFSFFSSHAANTFGLATFFSCLVRSRLLAASLITWSLVNCWTRLYLGVHYPSDIICGLLFGALTGLSVYTLYRRLYRRMFIGRTSCRTDGYTESGYAKSDVDMVITVFAFISCYVLIKALIQQ